MTAIVSQIASEIGVAASQVKAAVELLDGGSTVPFIARYRKEATGGIDDTQLRHLEERLGYLRDLADRRKAVLKSIDGQGKLDAALKAQIDAAQTRTALEDLYLPFKPKRRTKAQVAREAGLEPLARALMGNPQLDPLAEAAKFVDADKGVADSAAGLEGAQQILMEQFSEDAKLMGDLRETLWRDAKLSSKVMRGKKDEGEKFADYFDFEQRLRDVPSHRALAMFRGRKEKITSLTIDLDVEEGRKHPGPQRIARHFRIEQRGRPGDQWLMETTEQCWKSKVHTRLSVDLMLRLREAAEAEAIRVFAANMKDLLLAAPAGPRATMGLDPGFRSGVKVAVVDPTGKMVDSATIYPHQPRNDWDRSIATLAALAKRHNVEIVSIGNGTASRETDKLTTDLIRKHPELKLAKAVVSEAGASVYSASELAAKEFPDVDVSIRGAVSIARRLQDPLAELVKIDAKAIGVGQYQHDVDQAALARSLGGTVEDCVNGVGVNVNTASAQLLAHVSGLNQTLASNIVAFRDENGAFKSRPQLKKVARMGPKAFEQAAGFLRIMNGKNPLDASAVHPEAYTVVERIAKATGRPLTAMIGDRAFLTGLKPGDYADDKFGVPTVSDILVELEKPGRDPRPDFKTASFADGVEKLSDLKPDMKLEGVVTNVTNFGAFVDVGVHQDGLVHISQLADSFVKDPREIVKVGDVVHVRVMEVDVARKRIGLTMKSPNADAGRSDAGRAEVGGARGERGGASGGMRSRSDQGGSAKRPHSAAPAKKEKESDNAFAAAFKRAQK